MRTEQPEVLPKTLPGAVCIQWVRCGKPACKCARGELHGPYWYRFWREGGTLRKQYVRRSTLGAVRAACEERRRLEREAREQLRESHKWVRELLALAREMERDDRW